MINVRFEPEKTRTAAYDGEKMVGECIYSISGNNWTVDHTFVNESYGGQGIAGKLLAELVDKARESGVKMILSCSFAKKEFDRKEEYSDVLSK